MYKYMHFKTIFLCYLINLYNSLTNNNYMQTVRRANLYNKYIHERYKLYQLCLLTRRYVNIRNACNFILV